jgi:hypothetical protein
MANVIKDIRVSQWNRKTTELSSTSGLLIITIFIVHNSILQCEDRNNRQIIN